MQIVISLKKTKTRVIQSGSKVGKFTHNFQSNVLEEDFWFMRLVSWSWLIFYLKAKSFSEFELDP